MKYFKTYFYVNNEAIRVIIMTTIGILFGIYIQVPKFVLYTIVISSIVGIVIGNAVRRDFQKKCCYKCTRKNYCNIGVEGEKFFDYEKVNKDEMECMPCQKL